MLAPFIAEPPGLNYGREKEGMLQERDPTIASYAKLALYTLNFDMHLWTKNACGSAILISLSMGFLRKFLERASNRIFCKVKTAPPNVMAAQEP